MSTPLPAWLTSLVDQRMALIDQAIAVSPAPLIVTPLQEPPEGATDQEYERWDRSCDCCGKDCLHENFYTGQVMRTAQCGAQVIITYGVCQEHSHGG